MSKYTTDEWYDEWIKIMMNLKIIYTTLRFSDLRIRQIIICKITCTRNDQFLINYPVKQLIRGRSWNAMQLDQRKFLASHERHSRDIVTFNREMIAAWHKSTWTGLISFYDNARCFPLFRLIINHEGNVNPRIAHIYIYIVIPVDVANVEIKFDRENGNPSSIKAPSSSFNAKLLLGFYRRTRAPLTPNHRNMLACTRVPA